MRRRKYPIFRTQRWHYRSRSVFKLARSMRWIEACRTDSIEMVAEERIWLLQRKYAEGSWTNKEAARFVELNSIMNRLAPRVTAAQLLFLQDASADLLSHGQAS